jgi:hypothetical protein
MKGITPMTLYNVHINREMRLTFERIEADTPEAAAQIARERPSEDADDFEDCDGETFAALVDVVDDHEFEQSVMIDSEAQKLQKAAPELLAALEFALEFLTANNDGEEDVTGRIAAASAAIANARGSQLVAERKPIVIEVRGGIVQDVLNVPLGYVYKVADYDNIEADGETP